ncbi:prostaglandin reductase 1-like [Uranotaenia lowii]|uniref:prostaglandin reductase 1-like n=1 Tax=Uranotaenia lowii TaxID=190385 RepID=UPI00247B1E03|nr:prostaglandin reductase 1-like [Uranotaenia lowii]
MIRVHSATISSLLKQSHHIMLSSIVRRRLSSSCSLLSSTKSSSPSSSVLARKWIYAKTFKGEPSQQNFRLESENLPALKDGDFLAKAEFISVDPYMRPYMMAYPEGSLMIGGQISKVVESKNPAFPVGATVFGQFGWRTHTVCNPSKLERDFPYVLPELPGSLPTSLGLGVLGMPGNTAYFGLLELCSPKKGETVLVSGAAGAVGSLVGQIAKIQGCRVVGLAGSDEKCRWLKEIGFDETINYKTTADLYGDMKKAAPKGFDVYFDNVGGRTSELAIKLMNLYGRIAVCGTISNYNSTSIDKVTDPLRMMVFKQLKMEGFLVWRWNDRWMEGIEANLKWIKDGKLKWQETVTEGFENTPEAFMDMLKGGNVGKAVVKV